MIGHTEILVIGLVVLVLFGAAAIPRFARSLGKAKKEFQDGLKEGEKPESVTETTEESAAMSEKE